MYYINISVVITSGDYTLRILLRHFDERHFDTLMTHTLRHFDDTLMTHTLMKVCTFFNLLSLSMLSLCVSCFHLVAWEEGAWQCKRGKQILIIFTWERHCDSVKSLWLLKTYLTLLTIILFVILLVSVFAVFIRFKSGHIAGRSRQDSDLKKWL